MIELLAVIVILAIIALIATPIVINIINDSKESSMLRSADFYLDAVELSIANRALNNKKITNGIYSIMSNGNICFENIENNTCIDEMNIEVSGEVPTSGTITIADGKIIDIKLKYSNGKIVIIDENGNLVYSYEESPNLLNGTLTPVIYDGENWVVADVTKKWYSYKEQEWANAVLLNNNVSRETGDIVTVDGTNPDALAMFVWIPRYEYKIEGTYGKGGTSVDLPGEIEINFISKTDTTASEGYRVHPAFTFGVEELSGIWVGKFETSHTTLSTNEKVNNLGCSSETCEIADGLRILPNVTSLRDNNNSNFFYAIRSMERSGNAFGIDSSITDTHMMKNSEWGAVAYLSQSKYGKYGNSNYIGANKEIYQNKSVSYITGSSNGTPSQETRNTQCTYNDVTNNCGIGASTTGNIYGIYDMSGGAWERVMGVIANSNGDLWSGSSEDLNSGFDGKVGPEGIDYDGIPFPNMKYYDIYKASSGITISKITACNGGICYGHALSETASWYADHADFVSGSFPWLSRGGRYSDGTESGVFYLRASDGYSYAHSSARVVFVPTT